MTTVVTTSNVSQSIRRKNGAGTALDYGDLHYDLQRARELLDEEQFEGAFELAGGLCRRGNPDGLALPPAPGAADAAALTRPSSRAGSP